MAQRFPQANYRDVVKVAKKLGFYFYRMANGSKPIKRRTLKEILKDFQITAQKFIKFRKGKAY